MDQVFVHVKQTERGQATQLHATVRMKLNRITRRTYEILEITRKEIRNYSKLLLLPLAKYIIHFTHAFYTTSHTSKIL